MSNKERYDPEDLEQLMRERQFDQLLDEEKAYVLRHMSGAEEYEQVRSTLLAVSAHLEQESDIEPDVAIEENLMAEFASTNAVSEEKAGFTIWLNSVWAFLLPAQKSFYAKPAYQLAFTMLLVVGFFFFYNNMDERGGLAINEKVADEKQEETLKDRSSDSVNTKFKAQGLDKEKLNIENEGLLKNTEVKKELDVLTPIPPAMEADRKEQIALADEDLEMVMDDLAGSESAYKYIEQEKIDKATKDLYAPESGIKDSEIAVFDVQPSVASDETISQNGNAAGATQSLTFADSIEPRMGNSVEMDVSNEMLYSTSELEEVQISASKESRSKTRANKDKTAPLKSANMRQYSSLIGMLHTSL